MTISVPSVLPVTASYKVTLSPTEYALGEVVVKPKREHYRKKDNPAVEFVRRMIESRDNHSPYEKTSTATRTL